MNVDAQKPSECHWAAIKMYLSESLMAMVKQLYKPSTLRPMCPVHGTLMVEVYPTPVDSNEPTRDADPAFRCQSEHCELFWAREHEHFELLQGRPVYTNSDPGPPDALSGPEPRMLVAGGDPPYEPVDLEVFGL
jgi:hypothetical protein